MGTYRIYLNREGISNKNKYLNGSGKSSKVYNIYKRILLFIEILKFLIYLFHQMVLQKLLILGSQSNLNKKSKTSV